MIDSNNKMKNMTKSRRTSLINASALSHKQVTFSENYEKSKNLYYSALVLILKDKIEEMEQVSKVKSTDVFWSQLETMISRHSAQMDRVAQKVVDKRANLISQRKVIGTDHAERMNKAKNQLKILKKQIKEQKFQVSMIENRVEEKEAEEINAKIESLNLEIDQYDFRIKNLRNSIQEINNQIEKARVDNNSRSSNLENRRKNLDSRADNISSQLENTIQQINQVDAEIKDLEQKEKICMAVYESLKQPLPSIERIFLNQS